MSLLDIVAENISDYDLPGLSAIAVIKLTPDICVIVHDASRFLLCKDGPKGDFALNKHIDIAATQATDSIIGLNKLALSFLNANGCDPEYHFTLLSEVGESWAAPCRQFAQEIPMTHMLLDEEPWEIEFVDEPLKFWYKVDDLGYEYAIVR